MYAIQTGLIKVVYGYFTKKEQTKIIVCFRKKNDKPKFVVFFGSGNRIRTRTE